ncbi:MAG: shikimate kinase [Cyanobacteria bacterium P01_D01_bin.123]
MSAKDLINWVQLQHQLQGVNLYLIGMMGAGKSTLGGLLAQHLNYQFFDTDTLVETASGQTISDLFAREGEATFRDWETQVLTQLSAYTRLAIATGGGIVERRQNWSYLRDGLTLWLDVPASELYRRLEADPTPRPLLQTPQPLQTLTHLLERRQPLYAQADVRIPVTTQSLDATLFTLVDCVRASLRDHAPASRSLRDT